MRLVSPVRLVLIVLFASLLAGCGYNQIQQKDEAVKAGVGRGGQPVPAPRRPDPEPGQHGQGLCPHEEHVLTEVTEARARSARSRSTPNVNDPARSQQFQQAQGELSSALSRLLVVTENYPHLKADQNFRDLQAQLEGTENRITVARNRYIQTVQAYNVISASSR